MVIFMNDKERRGIGLCLAFKGANYGALLQSFATQYELEKRGIYTEILDYTRGKTNKYIFSPEAFVFLAVKKLYLTFDTKFGQKVVPDELHVINKKGRNEIADDFRHRRLHNIVQLNGYDALVERAKTYNAVMVGSDQLWPPDVSFSNYLSLMFAPEGVRRISYATSTGVEKYPWFVYRQARKFLNKIDYLSVREQKGYEIIKKITGRDAKIVCDPTYLISKEEWEKLIPNEQVTKKGYVFGFFLGCNAKMKALVRKYADLHNLRVVCILSNEVSEDDTIYADEILTGQTPEDFINLIRNAECVFTDSFHAFTFSVINEKEVYVSYRVKKGVRPRNQRIDNIVAKFGVQNRLVKDPDNYVFDENPIDYGRVTEIVKNFSKESAEFLDSATKGC